MASRVNTKFVVILVGAVIAMLAAVGGAYMFVSKSAADLEARGDQALAQGETRDAIRFYSKAVNKDTTEARYTEKWIDALEQYTPETETTYMDMFRGEYMLAINHASTVQRTDVEAYHRELGMMLDLLLSSYNRPSADRLIDRTGEALRFFDGIDGVDPSWPTLRRYRGIAWAEIAERDGVIDEENFALVRDDLSAALEADPSDDRARAALMRWTVYEARRTLEGDDMQPIIDAREEAIAMGREHLGDHPESPMVLVTTLAQRMNAARIEAATGLIDAQRMDAMRGAVRELDGEVNEIHATLMAMDAAEIPLDAFDTFLLLEGLSMPENGNALAIELVERMAAADPDDALVLQRTAGLLMGAERVGEALEIHRRIVDLENKPIGIEGATIFSARRASLASIATIHLDRLQRRDWGPGDEAYERELELAREARDAYAEGVSEDSRLLMLLNGRMHHVEGDLENALRLYKRFNQQTQGSNIAGLWWEARAAYQLDRLGTARQALIDTLDVNDTNLRALLLLADVEIRLQNYNDARRRYQRVLMVDSDNSTALAGMANIEALEDPDSISDPVLALTLKARKLRRGSGDAPGDLSGAIDTLRDGIASVDYAPRATRELVSLLLDAGDVEGAREIIDLAIQAHPNDEEMLSMRRAMRQDDTVDILIELIKQRETDPIQRDIAIAGIAYSRNRPDLLDETLESLLERAPQNTSVIDLAFVRALERDDIELARELAERGSETNADRVNGLSYQARIASFEGNHEESVRLLEQAQALGTGDSSVLRMLALERRMIGRIDAAAEAFERALSIRPDDQQSILQYMNTMIRSGRAEQALDIARRSQRYAMDNNAFITTWLSLESSLGGAEGRDFAIRQREKFLELNPGDMVNKEQLAALYVDAGEWAKARRLIDELRAAGDRLQYAVLEARWYADQGRVGNQSGLGLASRTLNEYIASQEEPGAGPYIAMARFMLDRGRSDLAVRAASEAVEREDPETLEGTKLMGDLLLSLNQYSDAASAFRKIIESGADQGDTYRMRLIDMLIRTRQFAEAREVFEGLDASSRGSMVSLLQLSEIQEGLGELTEARRTLDRAVAEYSENPLVYIKRAELLGGSQETFNDMLADIDAALQIDQDDWRAYRVRAAGYFAVDRRREALEDLQRAVRLNPRLDQALFGVINEMLIADQMSEAYDFALEIIEQRPQDASLIKSLGQLFESREQWRFAVDMYNRVWELQRSPAAGAELIDTIARSPDPDTDLANDIIRDLEEIAGEINESPGLLAARALVLKARDRDDLALREMTKAFDLSADQDDLLVQWSGNVSRYFVDEPTTEQIAYLRDLKRRNTNPEVNDWLDLFIAQRLIGVPSATDQAQTLFARLSEVDSLPKLQRSALRNWGTMLYARGQAENAVEVWRRGIEVFPDDWEMNNNLAYVLSVELGGHEEALGFAERAVEAGPGRSEPYDTLASVYTQLERYDEAEQMIEDGIVFARTLRARITLLLAQARIEIARGQPEQARSQLVDIRALLRAMPSRAPGLEAGADEIEAQIGSE